MKKKAKQKAGRKPMAEKERKVSVQVYVPGIRIEELGGIEKAREISLTALTKKQ